MRKVSDLFQYTYFENFEGGYSSLIVCVRFRGGGRKGREIIDILLHIYMNSRPPPLFFFNIFYHHPFPPQRSLYNPTLFSLPPPAYWPNSTLECLGRGVGRGGRSMGEIMTMREKRCNKGRVLREIVRSIRVLERSHSSPFEMWVVWSTARTNATNGCLYLPTFLCYHYLLNYITGLREL